MGCNAAGAVRRQEKGGRRVQQAVAVIGAKCPGGRRRAVLAAGMIWNTAPRVRPVEPLGDGGHHRVGLEQRGWISCRTPPADRLARIGHRSHSGSEAGLSGRNRRIVIEPRGLSVNRDGHPFPVGEDDDDAGLDCVLDSVSVGQ